MRTPFPAVALAALSGHAHASSHLSTLRLHCPDGVDVLPILVDADGGLGIDLLDCEGVRYSRGPAPADACIANGGAQVPLDVDLAMRRDGSLRHDGVTFRLYIGLRPCPVP